MKSRSDFIIPYGKQSISEEDIEAVCSVLRSDWLTQGAKVQEFEQALADQCGAKYCIAVANGTMALHLACLALDVNERDVGVTSPISFLASANCIAYCGGRPDFVDIDGETLCISTEGVEEYCKEQKIPKVVIPVDFAGIPADLPRLYDLADKFGFRLIEDAAHSIGSTYTYNGQKYACGSCSHTDLAAFSFHAVKTITSGEGGAILTNNDQLADKLRRLANHGIERKPTRFTGPTSHPAWYHEMQELGLNARLTDIQSVLGLSQLGRLEHFKAKRQQMVKDYNLAFEALVEKEIVQTPPWPDGTDPCYHLYTLRLGPNSRIGRDDLFHELRQKNIFCQVHYIPIYRQPFYQTRYDYNREQFPESEKYFSTCTSLPLFPDMDEITFQYMVEVLLSLLYEKSVSEEKI